MKILFVSDVFGSPGRNMLEKHLPQVRKDYGIDFVIVNAENSAHGKGITDDIYRKIMSLGVDIVTMGNHTWDKPDIDKILSKSGIIRPYNLSPEFRYFDVGIGTIEVPFKELKIRVTNLLGNSVFFKNMQTNCFHAMRDILSKIDRPDIHLVDFHSETTSEKYAFMWAFNGQVEAILGTHTHVPTNDACITAEGTAFICDVGMTGPAHGIIGAKRDDIIRRFFDPNFRFVLEVHKGPKQFCSVILEFDEIKRKMVRVQPFIIREGFDYLGTAVVERG